MAIIRTDKMPKEYTETIMCLATYLEDRLYGQVKIFYRDTDDSFTGNIAHRGVVFYFTVYEIGEQILNGVSSKSMGDIIIADYRKFLPTRFIKGGTNQ